MKTWYLGTDSIWFDWRLYADTDSFFGATVSIPVLFLQSPFFVVNRNQLQAVFLNIDMCLNIVGFSFSVWILLLKRAKNSRLRGDTKEWVGNSRKGNIPFSMPTKDRASNTAREIQLGNWSFLTTKVFEQSVLAVKLLCRIHIPASTEEVTLTSTRTGTGVSVGKPFPQELSLTWWGLQGRPVAHVSCYPATWITAALKY